MLDRIEFLLNRLRERLWVKPLFVCILSIGAAFLARLADDTGLGDLVPEISRDSIETLLEIISSSMLVIATFAVASMVTAYSSASNTATPRTFSLVISDDVSQNALSTFVGAFIYSIVALIALLNGYYDKAGRFALFALTLVVFAAVIFTFVRWVDRIARLGRLGASIDKVEDAATRAMERRKRQPCLGGRSRGSLDVSDWTPVCGPSIGYVQRISMSDLQACAEDMQLKVAVAALPGTFLFPRRPLAWCQPDGNQENELDTSAIAKAFLVGDDRVFDEDPRFGLVVLAEIASRALSPAVNDPGTAIDIIGTFVRLLENWGTPLAEDEEVETRFDRVFVPELDVEDLFDDSFGPVARDGAGLVEVALRIQKALASLTLSREDNLGEAARIHSRRALSLAEKALSLEHDVKAVRKLAAFSGQ